MFEICIFIETVALIGIVCLLYGEILNGSMQEEKRKAEAAVKDAENRADVAEKKVEDLEVIILKKNNETIEHDNAMQKLCGQVEKMNTEVKRAGFNFDFKKGTCMLFDDGYAKEKNDLRKERDDYIQEARFYEAECNRKDMCAEAVGYEFVIKKNKTAEMLRIVPKTPKTPKAWNDIMMY